LGLGTWDLGLGKTGRNKAWTWKRPEYRKNRTDLPINRSTSQPVNQSTNQPVNQSTSQPVNQSTSQRQAGQFRRYRQEWLFENGRKNDLENRKCLVRKALGILETFPNFPKLSQSFPNFPNLSVSFPIVPYRSQWFPIVPGKTPCVAKASRPTNPVRFEADSSFERFGPDGSGTDWVTD
jgi:hypothetical protein